jgi:glycosyltransferase involved in cell wall biosynthesis
MSALRLLAIIEAYSITGPAKNLLEFARLGKDSGIETSIATFARDTRENLFVQTAREQGVRVEVIKESGPFDRAAMRSLAEVAHRLHPDVIQTHAVKSHFLARLAGLPKRAPWVAFHHGYTWPTKRAQAYNQLDRWSLRTARQVLTVSEPFREELVARGVNRERIEIIHNAIPPDWGAASREPSVAAALRRSLVISEAHKVILIVGRLSKEKDHLTLIRAVARLPSAAGAHLLIVGEGPNRSAIEQEIAQLNLAASVTFTGHVPSAQPYYGIADLAVLSSLSEGSPNALLEAMAAGVPVVATTVGGIPEIVTNGESALLVPPSDLEAMSAAMARILVTEPDLAAQLVERSRILIRERHAPEARMRKLAAIYRQVVARYN